MRFDFLSHNAGDADLVVGSPANRPDLFVWSAAHGHYHLKDFNEFKLFNSKGVQVEIGHKQAFCLIDVERIHPNARADAQFGDCNANQGISGRVGGPLQQFAAVPVHCHRRHSGRRLHPPIDEQSRSRCDGRLSCDWRV